MDSWVTVTVRFAAVTPDDDLDADTYADRIGDLIATAIPKIDYSIEDGSASVVDWSQEAVR